MRDGRRPQAYWWPRPRRLHLLSVTRSPLEIALYSTSVLLATLSDHLHGRMRAHARASLKSQK